MLAEGREGVKPQILPFVLVNRRGGGYKFRENFFDV